MSFFVRYLGDSLVTLEAPAGVDGLRFIFLGGLAGRLGRARRVGAMGFEFKRIARYHSCEGGWT